MFAGPSRPRSQPRHRADGRPAPSGGRSLAAPAHRAPTAGRSRYHEPLLAPRKRRAPAGEHARTPVHRRNVEPVAVELQPQPEAGVDPVVRVRRSRLALALAVTLAAVPLLVLDNMSARADTNEAAVEVTYGAELRTAWDTASSVTTAPATTSTEATAPPTTEAPSTTAAPEPSTTSAPVVAAAAAPAPPTPAAPPTTAPPTPAPPSPSGGPNDPATWDRLAQCESGGNWSLSTGNGYYGGLQFSLATWKNVGGTGYPHQASKAEQVKRGKILQARAGWGQWPHCARQLGLL